MYSCVPKIHTFEVIFYICDLNIEGLGLKELINPKFYFCNFSTNCNEKLIIAFSKNVDNIQFKHL